MHVCFQTNPLLLVLMKQTDEMRQKAIRESRGPGPGARGQPELLSHRRAHGLRAHHFRSIKPSHRAQPHHHLATSNKACTECLDSCVGAGD